MGYLADTMLLEKSVDFLYLFVCHGCFLYNLKAKILIFLIIFAFYVDIMAGRNTIWDPLRKREVALTPEERVRQWCIHILKDRMKIPEHMMMSEAGFRLGEKQFRADVLVYDRKARPLMIVECKRPETELSKEVLDQALRYNMVLNVSYIMITNGNSTFIAERNDGGYSFIDYVPEYEKMICQQR